MNRPIFRAYAPASIGNVSLGFDLLGAALQPIGGEQLGDIVSVQESDSDRFSVTGKFAHKLPSDPAKNIVMACRDFFRQQCTSRQLQFPGISIELQKRLPIGSGLGSSASSIVAAFAAFNACISEPFSPSELLLMMGECEGQISGSIHYDNVAPSYLGGMTLMTGDDALPTLALPVPDTWYWVVCYSGASVSTAQARKVLPAHYSTADTLKFGQQLGVFVQALNVQNWSLAASVIQDVIAEPYRQSLLPGFAEAKQHCLTSGAMAFGISGSGPTVFALTDRVDVAQSLCHDLRAQYIQNDDGFSHICQIPSRGVVIDRL